MFVQRDMNGAIVGLYRQSQPFANEELPDDNAEVVALHKVIEAAISGVQPEASTSQD